MRGLHAGSSAALLAWFVGMATPGTGVVLVQRRTAGAALTPMSRHGVQGVPWHAAGVLNDDISSSTVTQNNLGGLGPSAGGAPVIRYENAGTIEGVSITVEISNLTEYLPAPGGEVNNARGAHNNSAFGIINVKCGTNTSLRYSFFDSVGNPVEIHSFWITFLDLDSDNKGQVHEYMGVTSQFAQFMVSNDTELIQTNLEDGGIVWESTKVGSGLDNPTDPKNMTPAMHNRAASVEFINASVVDTIFGLTTRPDGTCGPGRNLMFSFTSMEHTPTSYTCGTCVVWGDPHIITFKMHQRRLAEHPEREEFFRTRGWKNDQFTINQAGVYWLVKNSHVQIQGSYERNETSKTTTLSSLAVGGAFMQNRVLVIRPLSGQTTWEGDEILAALPSEFQNEYVDAKYHKGARMVKDGTRGPGIDVALPQGVTLRVNRWQHSLAAEISMCPTEGQLGQCGSFGDSAI